MQNKTNKSDTKKQHTLPRFYLERFADVKGQLSVYDKVKGKSFRANVKDVAQQRRFYDISPEAFGLDADATYDPQFVEHTLAEHEAVLSKSLKEFLENAKEGEEIDWEHRFALAYFMGLQMVRTPFARSKIHEIQNRAIEHLVQSEGPNMVAPGSPIYNQLHVPEYDWARIQAQVMLDPMASAQLMAPLVQRVWCIGVNKTGRPLYTSDNPVVMYKEEPQPGMGYGLASAGVEVALPLSPEIVLMLADGKMYPALLAYEGKRLTLNEDNVTFYNWLQVSRSERQVYCSTSDFALAEKLCRERPHLRDPKRQQVWVN